jgi:hypothetical protein
VLIQEQATVRGSQFYLAYKQLPTANGLKPMSMVAFGKHMKQRFKSIKSNGVIYQGIGLLAEPKAK